MARAKFSLRMGAIVVVLALTSGCVASFRNHGYVPNPEDLDEIVVGVDTRASVQDTVGSPSSSGVLDDSGFYYVRSRVRSFAYRAPEVVEREVLAISFDESGTVTNIERFGLEDGQIIALERRVTENSVESLPILRQILSSFGRIGLPQDI